jgi:hypothetical protein
MHSNHTDEGAASASASAAPETLDLDAARDLVAQDLDRRMQECSAEIQQVLAKYGMQMNVIPEQVIPARVSLVPLN